MGQPQSKKKDPKKKVSFKRIDSELKASRHDKLNTLENQSYSFVQSFPQFGDSRENPTALLDLCVLANKPTRNCKIQFENNLLVKFLEKTCQDEAVVVKVKDKAFLMGVFDGHGPRGERISKMCARTMQRRMKKDSEVKNLFENPKDSLCALIKELHEIASQNKHLQARSSGSTATLALLNSNKLDLSWVGDSKAVIFTTYHKKFLKMEAFDLTQDHDFRTEEEKERIQAQGGIVKQHDREDEGPLRVFSLKRPKQPGLAMSKSIGDLAAHVVGVNAEADHLSIDISNIPETYRPKEDNSTSDLAHCIVILASDGLWNAMPKETVAKYLSLQLYHKIENGEKIGSGMDYNLSATLCLEAQRRWLKALAASVNVTDDVSAICMVLF